MINKNLSDSIKRVAAATALLLCLFSTSCKAGGEDRPDASTDGTLSGTGQVSGADETDDVRSDDISLYTIVYPSDAGEAVKTMAVNLRKALEAKTGKTIKIKDDWVMPGGSENNGDYEILIGGTNRSETENLAIDVLCNDFLIAASGNKIVIFANTEELLGEAVSCFQLTLKKKTGYISGREAI